ncbi:hypothetical protein M404DRAFT_855344 [Pisolithus tinctorius Marx 270]|uniref:Uncharacterized protein n=1 Tax=Pisolithus tinctorius Marx 270 TaxID=870435 RepID=A0A0C3NS24_PISTI|nr:hypothetical protein M404DRAFT_855344 [Pisolithus tinctorius Marx 270]
MEFHWETSLTKTNVVWIVLPRSSTERRISRDEWQPHLNVDPLRLRVLRSPISQFKQFSARVPRRFKIFFSQVFPEQHQGDRERWNHGHDQSVTGLNHIFAYW